MCVVGYWKIIFMPYYVFRAGLGGALRSLAQWQESVPLAGGLERGGGEGPFQPKLLYDSVT